MMMTAFAILPCPSHSFPNFMGLVCASAFAPMASKVARRINRSRNMAILWLAKRHKSITAAPDLTMMCADFAGTGGNMKRLDVLAYVLVALIGASAVASGQ